MFKKVTYPSPFKKDVTWFGFITLHYTLIPESPAEMKAIIKTWKETGRPLRNK